MYIYHGCVLIYFVYSTDDHNVLVCDKNLGKTNHGFYADVLLLPQTKGHVSKKVVLCAKEDVVKIGFRAGKTFV